MPARPHISAEQGVTQLGAELPRLTAAEQRVAGILANHASRTWYRVRRLNAGSAQIIFASASKMTMASAAAFSAAHCIGSWASAACSEVMFIIKPCRQCGLPSLYRTISAVSRMSRYEPSEWRKRYVNSEPRSAARSALSRDRT